MELALPRDGQEDRKFACVKKKLRDSEGKPIGTANDNPILDTRMFDVEFEDGYTDSLAANLIAENLFAQVDSEGNRHLYVKEIQGHCKNEDAIEKGDDAFEVLKSGNRIRKRTTKGWEILVEWKDGRSTWTSLKDIKHNFPIEMAEYAVKNKIHYEPVFAWWVPFTLKKRNIIVSKVKAKYWEKTHKFGIRIPKSVEEAKRIDKDNGNTLWWDANCQEMENVRIAFEKYE